jgi:hypothetical protein
VAGGRFSDRQPPFYDIQRGREEAAIRAIAVTAADEAI